MRPYRGRFAPTPSGPLHAGSIVAALASWLDARAHGGQWLVRIEDTDTPRCVPGADRFILQQLHGLGLVPDEAARWQSKRVIHYEAALQHLRAQGLAYGCACSRQDIERAQASQGAARGRHSTAVYPGTCRLGTKGRPSRAWRVRIDDPLAKACSAWHDRRLGSQHHELSTEVGDFVVRRADGLWAYQLAVVVDDADQGITDVVRGEDLADNTPRQRYLQTLLGLPAPRYLHTALVRAADGQKLSKQTGAEAISTDQPLRVLQDAAKVLELPMQPLSSIVSSPTPRSTQIAGLPDADVQRALVGRWLEHATQAWARRWLPDHGGRRPSP